MNASRWGLINEKTSVQEMKDYLVLRREFLDDIWLGDEQCCYVRVTQKSGANHYFVLKPGSLLPRQLWHESEDPLWEYRWYDSQTGEYFDLNTPIDSDRELYVRYEQIFQPEETQPVQEPEQEISQPEEKLKASVQEKIDPYDIPEEERIPTTRVMPVVVFALMLVAVFTAGIIRCYTDRRKM